MTPEEADRKTPELLRLEAGVNLSQLAELAGVSLASVSRIEDGLTVGLRPSTIYKIAPHLVRLLAAKGTELTATQYLEICVRKRDEMLRAGITRRTVGKLRHIARIQKRGERAAG